MIQGFRYFERYRNYSSDENSDINYRYFTFDPEVRVSNTEIDEYCTNKNLAPEAAAQAIAANPFIVSRPEDRQVSSSPSSRWLTP